MTDFIEDGHECDSPVSVAVEGTGIPVIDDGATVYERKDGHLSVNRRADVHFPIVTEEREWIQEIDAFHDGGDIQVADIAMSSIDNNVVTDDTAADVTESPSGTGLDAGTGEGSQEQHILRGYINGVGSSGAANRGRFRVLGPFKMLSSIRADATFDDNATYGDLLSWFTERFAEGQSVFDSVTYTTSLNTGEPLGTPAGESSIGRNVVLNVSGNRDTLADAAKQLIEGVGLHLEFRPQQGRGTGIKLHAHAVDDVPTAQFDARDDKDLQVIENNALYEMRPFNSITLRGKGGAYIDLSGSTQYQNLGEISDALFGDGTYPEATAKYPPLVERAGGEVGQTKTSKTSNANKLEDEARSALKNRLDEVSGGSMLTAIKPSASLYDTIVTTPACAGVVQTDVPELTYEVQRAKHTVAPSNEENNIPTSEFSVSMHIDPSKIEVESTRKDTQPSKGSENKPPDSRPGQSITWGWS